MPSFLSALCGVDNDALLASYECTLREYGFPAASSLEPQPSLPRKLQSGTVTVVQRVSPDLRLNPHLHIIALDGAFAEQPDGPPRFLQLPRLGSLDVAELLATIRQRVLSRLARRGIIEHVQDLTLLPSEALDHEPALSQLPSPPSPGSCLPGPSSPARAPAPFASSLRRRDHRPAVRNRLRLLATRRNRRRA